MSGRALPFVADWPASTWWSPTPVIGFRLWHLAGGSLWGAVHAWVRPALEARCVRGAGVPHEGCGCGIYALKQPEDLWRPAVPVGPAGACGPVVYGVVALTGRVVEHRRGYRAAWARAMAVAACQPGLVVCSSRPEWIEGLFARPAPALAEAARGGAGGTRVAAGPGALRRARQYLATEARRFEEAWTSVSSSA